MAALAVFVFALALRAKLSLYDPPQPGKISAAAAAKLWLNGEKVVLTGTLPALWLAAWLVSFFPVRRVLALAHERPLAPRHLDRLELFRFLRPPPAF